MSIAVLLVGDADSRGATVQLDLWPESFRVVPFQSKICRFFSTMLPTR